MGNEAPKNAVLIHGTWHGGWCWRPVASVLKAYGWRIVDTSLQGCCDRRHLLGPTLSVSSMADDLCGLVDRAAFDDVVVMAHSSGGLVAAELARRMPRRIHHVMLLDAVVPEPGETGFDFYPDADRAWRIDQAMRVGEAFVIPVPHRLPVEWGLDDERYAWARMLMTPHPLAAFTTPSSGWGPQTRDLDVTYVSCNRPPHPILDLSKRRARERMHWSWIDIDEPHDCMLVNPLLTASLLLDAARHSGERTESQRG